MAFAEGLVDLSLFDWAPTTDHRSTTADFPALYNNRWEPTSNEVHEYYAPAHHGEGTRQDEVAISREVVMKPLPPLPRTRICQQAASRYDDGSQCILKRIRRSGSGDNNHSPSALLQRRNVPATPQLTLSVPPTNQGHRHRPSEMVWMPEEQMWLVIGETEYPNGNNGPRTDYPAPSYPTPPAYTPGGYVRSEPASRVTSQWDMTPPQTPIQSQLQRLLQHPRDEERLSPLFQEAMNSVPLTDPLDLPPPPSYEGIMRQAPTISGPRSSVSESFISSPSSTDSSTYMQRASTTGSHRPRSHVDSSIQRSVSRSESPVSGRSMSQTRTNDSNRTLATPNMQNYLGPNRSWAGLARKIARPSSAT